LLSSALAQQLPNLLQAVLHHERLQARDGTLTLLVNHIAEEPNASDKVHVQLHLSAARQEACHAGHISCGMHRRINGASKTW
jgi:hypothetical protein